MQVASWMQRRGGGESCLERAERLEPSPESRAAWPREEVTAACDQSRTALALPPPRTSLTPLLGIEPPERAAWQRGQEGGDSLQQDFRETLICVLFT